MKAASIVALIAGLCLPAPAARGGDNPLDRFTRSWRDDPVWHDGQAECATYDAVRTIYGKSRRYTATLYTNKEHASAETFTKSADDRGRGVFKHHLREDIPTENYTYHYSTMVYVGTEDLKSLKIDMGSQEDCGATFKQYINHAGTLNWTQFSYFPDQGNRRGTYEPPADLVFHDALSLVLRGFPFDEPPEELDLQVVPDQTATRLSPSEPVGAVVVYRGSESLALPVGRTEAHRLDVTMGDEADRRSTGRYWFAADPGMLHVMVRHEGPGGMEYHLREVRRCAYWRR